MSYAQQCFNCEDKRCPKAGRHITSVTSRCAGKVGLFEYVARKGDAKSLAAIGVILERYGYKVERYVDRALPAYLEEEVKGD